MSKLLLVFGATGQQGGSVIASVLNDPTLSKQYAIRAVTRDATKPASQSLGQKGIEVVQGDVDDALSLAPIMHGVHTVFANLVTVYDDNTKAREITQGKAVADAAVAAGVQYIIFSTLPNVAKISGGKYVHCDHFDAKAEVEEYIRALPIQSSFFAPGSFMQNFGGMMAPQPSRDGDGTFAINNIVTPQTQMPLIETVEDTGKYIGAVLAEPEKFEGKVLSAATKLYSFEKVAQTISELTGKTVRYNQIPVEMFKKFLPPAAADNLVEMLLYFQDFGYYGPETEMLVEWTAQNARGKLTTFEEYIAKNIHLE
jgi:uncharacterized protein YbjT (DUF2867 family)